MFNVGSSPTVPVRLTKYFWQAGGVSFNMYWSDPTGCLLTYRGSLQALALASALHLFSCAVTMKLSLIQSKPALS